MTLTSPERLEDAAIAAQTDWYAAVPAPFGAAANAVTGATVFSVRSQPMSSYLNQVVVTGDEVDMMAALARIGHARDPLVRVPEWTGRSHVPGLRPAEDLVRVTMRLDDLPPVPPLPAGMHLDLVTDPAQAEQVGAASAEGVAAVSQSVTVGRPGWIWTAVTGPEGDLVAAGSCFVAEGVAVCGNAGVAADQRRQGLHTALLVARLRAAAAAGATVMTSLAGADSPSYLSQARLGATVACHVTHHRR